MTLLLQQLKVRRQEAHPDERTSEGYAKSLGYVLCR